MTPSEIEQDIREAYTGVLSEEVIKGTIIFWREKARKLLEGKDGEIAALQVEVERLKTFRCDHHAFPSDATINPHESGSCWVCWSEYKRGFDEGYKQSEDEATALSAELEICREALVECDRVLNLLPNRPIIGSEAEALIFAAMHNMLRKALSLPPSELGRKVMDEHASMIDALKSIQQNDKTEYDYNGKEALNRNGQKPGPGKRFSTPREIAMAELDNLQKGGG